MRSSGAGPVFFGACLASAAIQQCSCFTPSSVVNTRVSAPPSAGAYGLRASRTSLGATVSSADDRRSNHATSTGTSRRQRQKARRKTRLASTKERSSGTNTPLAVDARWTTSQQFEAEVAARRASGASFAAQLLLFTEDGHDHDRVDTTSTAGVRRRSITRNGDDSLLEAPSLETPATIEKKSARKGGSRSVRESSAPTRHATAAAAAAAAAAAKLEHRRVLDMTHPPAELLQSAGTRSIGEGQGETVESKQAQEDGEMSLWVSRGMLAGAAALYGTNFGCVKLLEESVPMGLAAALRFSVAVVPFIPSLRKLNPGVFRAGAEIGVLNAIGYYGQSESLMTTTASKSAFICSLAVVLVPVLDAVFGAKDGDEVKAAKAAEKKNAGGLFANLTGPWFPALLAAAGVACLELVGVEGGPNAGDVWALVQPLCFGLGFWRTERLSRKFPEDTFGLVGAQMLTVAVLAGVWCAGAGDLPPSLDSLKETLMPASGSLAVPISLLWTGLVTTALTVFAETFAMRNVSAAESTVILSTEPIWGTAFAAILLGETIGWNTGLGAVLIVAACTWTSVGPALQSKVLSLIAAGGAAGSVGEGGGVDVDDLTETVGTVVKDLVKDQM